MIHYEMQTPMYHIYTHARVILSMCHAKLALLFITQSFSLLQTTYLNNQLTVDHD